MIFCQGSLYGFKLNLFTEDRVVYLNFKNSANDARMYLERDKEALLSRLETEKDLKKRSEIQNEVRQIESELDGLNEMEPNGGALLMNGLQNNLDGINKSLENEKDIKKREKLNAQRLNCLKALQERQRPVSNQTELREATDQIKSDQRIIDRLADGQLDHIDIEMLLNSDMLTFMDHDFQGELRIAFEQMFTSDNVNAALGRSRESIFQESDQAWMTRKQKIEANIGDLKATKQQLIVTLNRAGGGKDSDSLRERLKEIDSQIRHFEDELKNGRSGWTHRHRTTIELRESSRSLSNAVNPDTLQKLGLFIKEAQALRVEKIQEYLETQFTRLEEELRTLKGKNVFSPAILESLETELYQNRGALITAKHADPALLSKIAENIDNAKAHLSTDAEDIREAKEKRPEFEKAIRQDYAGFESVINGVYRQNLEKLINDYRLKQKEEGFSEDSAIVRKAITALHQISDPASDLHQKMLELGQRMDHMDAMTPEELVIFGQELTTMKSRIEILKDFNEERVSKMAHDTIQELEVAKDPQEIRAILEKNLGTEHLQFVNHSEFEGKYRKYTQKGYMVFYENEKQNGEKEWKIILSEDAMKTSVDVKNLKKQLTHELLHLEFEKGRKIKDDVRRELVEKNPEQWSRIRESFLEVASSTEKTPPTEAGWTDDDILSELFAMQNEIGRVWSKGDSPTDKLNNLLVGAGMANALGDVKKKANEYREEAKSKIRGYEEGVDEEGGGGSSEAKAPSTPEEASIEKFGEEIESIAKRIEELKASDHVGGVDGATELLDAMEEFNNGTRNLNDDLTGDPGNILLSTAIEERNSKVTGDLGKVEEEVAKIAKIAPNTELNPLRALWIRTTFTSLEDWVQVGVDAYEFIQRRHKRKVADHAAKLGMALASGTNLGRESKARLQKAEADEVQEWQGRYTNLDAWQLLDELQSMAESLVPNQDQLKAILRILAEKGRLNWQDPNLWKILNKLQSAVLLRPGDRELLKNPILLKQKLHKALGEIFDYGEYIDLEQKNKSSYENKKKDWNNTNKEMANSLTGRLDELLAQKRAGEKVDPILYESIIEYCLEDGKSYAENVMFHLIAGMAEGILSPDRGIALAAGGILNKWAAIDWFNTFSPPLDTDDWKAYAEKNFGRDFKRGSVSADGYGGQFKNWFWTTVQNEKRVVDRVRKSVGERNWDHDWGRSVACLGDAMTAKQFYSGKGGQQETKITAVSNAYVGMVQYMEENAKNPRFANRKNFARMAGWIAMSEGILNKTAYRTTTNDTFTRADDSMNRDVAREAGVGNHATLNTFGHRKITESFLFMVDAEFFGIFSGKEARSDEQQKNLGKAARDYLMRKYPELAPDIEEIESINQIYDNIDLIMNHIFSKMPEEQFRTILASVAAGAKG